MIANLLKDRVQIQVKAVTQTVLGRSIVWELVETRYARVIPLDAKARAVYQQLKSEVTHKVIFKGSVALSLGNNRLLCKGKTLELVEPPQTIENSTTVVCKEI